MQAQTIQARTLWNGERFSLTGDEGVYVVKTYRKSGSSARTERSERRLTTKTSGFLGVGRRWRRWDELKTPVEDLHLDQEVTRVP